MLGSYAVYNQEEN